MDTMENFAALLRVAGVTLLMKPTTRLALFTFVMALASWAQDPFPGSGTSAQTISTGTLRLD